MGNRSTVPKPVGYTEKESVEIRKKILNEHNRIRALNGVAKLTTVESMNKTAQEAANSMATKDKLESANTKYSEILYSGSGTGVKAENVVDHFYSNGNKGTKPQLTQMLSSTSSNLGIGVSRSPRGTLYVCLLYEGSHPPGNPQAHTNITLNYGNQSTSQSSPNNSLPSPNSSSSSKPNVIPVNANNNNNNVKVSNGNLDQIREQILQRHNYHRKNHHVGPLKLDASLNQFAQKYAEELARKNVMRHSPEATSGKYGENIYMCYGTGAGAVGASDAWYSEIKNYNFKNGGFSMNTGHFTGMIWKGVTSMGVGVASTPSGATYVVGSYSPPGNMAGRFQENVLPI